MKINFLYFSAIVFIISCWLVTPNLLNPKEDILDESTTRNNIEILPTTLSKHNELSKNFNDNATGSTTPNASTLVSEITSQPKSNKPLDFFFSLEL